MKPPRHLFPTFTLKFALACALSLCAAVGVRAVNYNIDLTDPAASVTINNAIFKYDNINSGSGTYTRMFAVQDGGDGDSIAKGYNWFGSGTRFDQKGGSFLPQQNLGSIPVVVINGVSYIQFVYDGNDAPPLTLLDFRVYIKSDPTNLNVPVDLGTNDSDANLANLGQLVYQTGGDTLTITAFKSGSGTDDMSINIPLSLFVNQGFTNNDDVYVWMKWDNDDGGFEELAIDKSLTTTFATAVPEVKTAWGGITMILLLGMMRHRRFGQQPVTAAA